MYTSLPIAWWSETKNAGIQAAEKIFREAGRGPSEKELAYLYALAGMDLAVAAMKNALVERQDAAEVELNADDVYQAFSELEGYQVLGGLMEIDFSAGLAGAVRNAGVEVSPRGGV